jgi:ATP-dependent exoDNAse (exonuclease V) alpha subunit
VQDREFGLQFKAEMLTSTAPTTKEGIEKYLGSDMVKGIGPVFAKKLAATFGDGIFDIIEQQSARLADVGGIGPNPNPAIRRHIPFVCQIIHIRYKRFSRSCSLCHVRITMDFQPHSSRQRSPAPVFVKSCQEALGHVDTNG